MGMTGFSDAEMALLSGLDAVAWVTRTRITYTDSFKREAVTRYRRGESPVRIFREAGLDPRIIGNKRIERCIAPVETRTAGRRDDAPACPGERRRQGGKTRADERGARPDHAHQRTRGTAATARTGHGGRDRPMSADPNPVDRLEQAATQFKNSGVIQLAVQGLLLEGVARDLRRCDTATVGCVELSAWLNRGIRELERRKRIVDAQITLIGPQHGEYTRYTKYGRNL